jgi:DNA-binding MarR family transcriptional regulator
MTSGREVARALRASYPALRRQTNSCFAEDGVTADQFVLLAALADADGVTRQELVRRVGSGPGTVRAMLLLEGGGLASRERHPADGRARRVTLTGKGRRLFEQLLTRSEGLRVRRLAALRPEEVTALVGRQRRGHFQHAAVDRVRRRAVHDRPGKGRRPL